MRSLSKQSLLCFQCRGLEYTIGEEEHALCGFGGILHFSCVSLSANHKLMVMSKRTCGYNLSADVSMHVNTVCDRHTGVSSNNFC